MTKDMKQALVDVFGSPCSEDLDLKDFRAISEALDLHLDGPCLVAERLAERVSVGDLVRSAYKRGIIIGLRAAETVELNRMAKLEDDR